MTKPSRPEHVLTCSCGNTVTLAVGRLADATQIGRAAQREGWMHLRKSEYLCATCAAARKAAKASGR